MKDIAASLSFNLDVEVAGGRVALVSSDVIFIVFMIDIEICWKCALIMCKTLITHFIAVFICASLMGVNFIVDYFQILQPYLEMFYRCYS